MEFLGNPASFLAAILALPVLWFAKRSLADENDRGGVLAVWFVMAIVVLYILWYGGMFGGGKFSGFGFPRVTGVFLTGLVPVHPSRMHASLDPVSD